MGEFDLYIPETFSVREQSVLFDFIQENSFGILFSQGEEKPFATHLPFLVDEENGTLYGHLARANPQWQDLKGGVLVVFQGPHAYISPSWYGERVCQLGIISLFMYTGNFPLWRQKS